MLADLKAEGRRFDPAPAHRLTGRAPYLTTAETNARTLLDPRKMLVVVPSRAGPAYYFRHRLDFRRHGHANATMRAPYYSAMAQGQALSLFARLATTSAVAAPARRTYAVAAEATFRSFLIGRGAQGTNPRTGTANPWTTFVDPGRYLWLEEFAQPSNSPGPDRTINGHMYAIFGLYDYFRMIRGESARLAAQALQLIDGAVTTLVHYFPAIRRRGWVSRYCLTDGTAAPTYHIGVTRQYGVLYQMTHAPELAAVADSLYWDFPDYRVSERIVLRPTTVNGYRFDGQGRVVRRKTHALRTPSSASITQRIRIRGQDGYYLFVTSGLFAGFFVREDPATAFIPGFTRHTVWEPGRTAVFAAGRPYVGVRLRRDRPRQRPSVHPPLRVDHPPAATRRATFNGRDYVLISGDIFSGMWVDGSVIPIA